MCTHRVTSRWGRIWDVYTGVVVAGFVAIETYGLLTEGSEATYSHTWQTMVGAIVPCRHTLVRRGLVITIAVWLVAHLGFGKAGWAPPQMRRCQTATRHLTTTESACT